MTRSALENAKMANDKRIADEKNATTREVEKRKLHDKAIERDWKSRENYKDRVLGYVNAGVNAGKAIAGGVGAAINDPAFYKQYLPDLDKYTNLPTYQRLGAEPWAGDFVIQGGTTNTYGTHLPGIMIIGYLPTIGNQTLGALSNASFPVNQILMRSKEQVLKLNSRSSVNWEPADLGLNIFCTADIITYICEIRRALLAYQTYMGDNAYFAASLIEALGFDYSDVVSNFADYKKRLQVIIERFNNSIVAPADLTLFARRLFLASNVFTDSNDVTKVKQIYAYKQLDFFQLDGSGAGASLAGRNLSTIRISVAFQKIESMIQSIVENPDYIEMYADLRHAWDNLYKLNPIFNADEKIQFNTHPSNREQIHNIKTIPFITQGGGVGYTPSDWSLNQDSAGYLYQGNRNVYYNITGLTSSEKDNLKSLVTMSTNRSGKGQLMDTYHAPISGDDMLDLTRALYTFGPATEDSSTVYWPVVSCGTEVMWDMRIYALNSANTLYFVPGGSIMIDVVNATYLNYTSNTIMAYISLLSKFDWHPITEVMNLNTANVVPSWANCGVNKYNVTELENSFVIKHDDIVALNEACVLSELYLKNSTFVRK